LPHLPSHPRPARLRAANPARAGLRLLAVWLAWLLLVAWIPQARAAGELVLIDADGEIDGWPALRVLDDPLGQWQAEDMVARGQNFVRPATPHANLGVRAHPVWLRLSVTVPRGESGRWLMHLDYPSLDRVDVHVVTDGRIVQHLRLGDHQLYAARPFQTRAHAVPLALEPGVEHELLLRVQTTSSMIVPLRFIKQELLAEREASFQMVQGIAAGLGLCLLLYSLGHWLSLRDTSYLYYALSVSCISLFFFAYHGLGPQHVWGSSEWLTRNMAPLVILPAITGGVLFLERVLEVDGLAPRLALAMKLTAGLAALFSAGFLVGVIDYRMAQLAGTVLGPTPIVLGLPAAFLRARRGDRAAMYVLFGWGIYAMGILIMAALLRGMVPVNAWTENGFQTGAMTEMVMWLLVLGVRTSELRRRVERADRERDSLRLLAHSDALTGLPNRRGLEIEISRALLHNRRDRLLAVYLLDLDGFKAVNDRWGHDAGDELLKSVAGRLSFALRSNDVVARLGGDEFVVVAGNLGSDDDARRVGAKLLQAFAEPFVIQGRSCAVGLTIGYALAPLDGEDEASLLKRADAAMYAGKQAGKQCVRRSPPQLETVGA
jgi:diguanylate cyclase (GGDEF)-like protein